MKKTNEFSCSVYVAHGLVYRSIYYVSGPGNISVVFLSMEGQIALFVYSCLCELRPTTCLKALVNYEDMATQSSLKQPPEHKHNTARLLVVVMATI